MTSDRLNAFSTSVFEAGRVGQERDRWWDARVEYVKKGDWKKATTVEEAYLKPLGKKEAKAYKEASAALSGVGDLTEEESSQEPANSPFISLGELLKQDFPETKWLVDKLIPMGGLVAISGYPGSYKSWLAHHLAFCVATGEKFLGHFDTDKGRVLIIDRENQPRLLQERFQALGALPDMPIGLWLEELFVGNKTDMELIRKRIRDEGIGLVIVDSLVRIHRADENDASQMAQVFASLRQFQDAGATVVFTHHHRKQSPFGRSLPSENLRGSSDILAAVDCHMAVEAREAGEIKITQTKLRQAETQKPFLASLTEYGKILTFIFQGELEELKEKAEQAKEEILGILKEGDRSRQELHQALGQGYGRQAIDRALRELTDEKKTTSLRAEKNKKIFSLTEATKEVGGESDRLL